MRRIITLLVAVLAVASLVFMAGCNQAAKEESSTNTAPEKKEPLKVGAVLSLSGTGSSLGLPEKQTLEMLKDAVNDDGGIDGRQVELFIEDDQSDPAKAKAAIDKLMAKKVHVIIGGSITPVTLVVKTEAAKAKIPQMAPAAGIKITEPDFNYTFRTAQSDALAVAKVIEYLSETAKIKKFAIINVDSAFGNSGLEVLKKEAPGAGLEVVGSEVYAPGATDVSAQLTKLRSTDAETIVIWDTSAGSAIVVKSAAQLGIDVPLVGSHGIASKAFINLAGESASNVVFPAGKILDPSSAEGEQKDVIDAFVADFKAKYNADPDTFAGHAYDAFQIVIAAAKTAGNDPAKLRDEIEKTDSFVGISGIFTYGAGNHDGLKTSDLVMWKIENGVWKEVK
ncbi:MAG: ABC transporter substrate-binding protein [Candidatus Aquicultorales bacterium]